MSRRVFLGIAALACVLGLCGPLRAQEATRAAPAASSQFPELPLRRDEGSVSGGVMAWGVVAIAAALAASWYWRRRASHAGLRRPSVVVLPGRALTTHASLHVVEWEEERLLIACTAQSVTVVSRRPIDAVAPGAEKQ
jgi:hypothetical protein